MDKELLESYDKLLTRLYLIALKLFYIHSNLSKFPSVVKERVKEGIKVHQKQLVDFETVK